MSSLAEREREPQGDARMTTSIEHDLREALIALLQAYQSQLVRLGFDDRDRANLDVVKKALVALERRP